MTQPLVDNGEFRRVGECPTPWPCFVIAARQDVIEQQPEVLKKMVSIITRNAQAFKHSTDAVTLVINRFGIKPADAKAWLENTQWANGEPLSLDILQRVGQTLLELNVIEQVAEPGDLYQAL